MFVCTQRIRPMRISAKIVLLAFLCLPTWALGDLTKIETQTPLRAVYVLPDSDAELITVSMVILAGEVDFDGPEGLSHYLEHLMFWHADKLNSDTMHARGGNAWVNGIVTAYYNSGEASELEDMFEFASRILTPPTLAPTFMLDERKVVTREYDLRVSENPDWRVLMDMRKQLYDNHPLSRSVIGTPESIMSLTLDQARAFHSQFYHASNAVLLVSGNVSEAQIKKLANARFASLDTSPEHTQSWRQVVIEGALDETQHYREKQAKSDRLLYSSLQKWTGLSDDIQEEYTRELVQRLFDSALPGSLAKPLRLDNFVISEYQVGLNKILDDQIELIIFAKPDAGVSLETAAKKIDEALLLQGEQGIPLLSFERLKKRWLQTVKRESSYEQDHLWRAWRFLSLGLEPNSGTDHYKRIEAISKADVDALLAALGAPQRKITGFIKGE